MCARELGKKERGNGKNKEKKGTWKEAEKEMKGGSEKENVQLVPVVAAVQLGRCCFEFWQSGGNIHVDYSALHIHMCRMLSE